MPKEISLTRGLVALVDDDDYERMLLYKWHTQSTNYSFYAVTNVTEKRTNRVRTQRTMPMHRFILCPPPGVFVDHKDGNGLNNQKANLRLCSRSQNGANRQMQKNNTTGLRGVYIYHHQKTGETFYRAAIKVSGTNLWLGDFLDSILAARTYDITARRYFGEFARLNLQEDGT